MPRIYLDNSMTTRPSKGALSSMMPFLTDRWGNPSAPHQMGQELLPEIRESLKKIYSLLGAKESDDIIFTSSGAEAINHVIASAYHDVTMSTGRNQFITSAVDEAPAIMSIGRLEQMGCVGKMVQPEKNGRVTADVIADALTPRTALVSLSWANGLTGVIHPVAEIADLCRERGVLFHVDATHVLGKLFFELEDIGADFITFNGDHIHAPKGTGALYIKEGIKCSPFILGGVEQGGYRAGSYNVAGLVALGFAADEMRESLDFLCTEVVRLRNKLETEITEAIPGAEVLFRDQERLPHCTAITFPGISNEAFLYILNRQGVFASIGGGSFQKIGFLVGNETAISFSLSRETTEEEIERAIEIVVSKAHAFDKLKL